MHEDITRAGGLTIGLDLGDRFTEGRVLDASGQVVEAFRVRTTAELALGPRLASFSPCRVVLEVGTHSPWVSRVLPATLRSAVGGGLRAIGAMPGAQLAGGVVGASRASSAARACS